MATLLERVNAEMERYPNAESAALDHLRMAHAHLFEETEGRDVDNWLSDIERIISTLESKGTPGIFKYPSGTKLFTKDGRRYSNALVIGHDNLANKVRTESGRSILLADFEIEDMFYPVINN